MDCLLARAEVCWNLSAVINGPLQQLIDNYRRILLSIISNNEGHIGWNR